MRTISALLPLIVLIAASSLVQGCATTGDRPNILTTEDEKNLGAELSAQVEKEQTVYPSPALQTYVRQIGDRLGRMSPRQDVDYQFTVIDSPDTVNAFALPGGHLYVYTGLMKLCTNEAELASVMAHEIAHVAASHHGESLTRQYGIEYILTALIGDDPGPLAQIGVGLASLTFSRAQETEADTIGMEILFRAGYNPEAMVTFMEKMLASEQASGGGQPLAFFSSHPATAERITRLRNQAATYPLELRKASPVYAERYQKEALSILK